MVERAQSAGVNPSRPTCARGVLFMRWKDKPYVRPPEPPDFIFVRRFLWLPFNGDGETRWLECASYRWKRLKYGGFYTTTFLFDGWVEHDPLSCHPGLWIGGFGFQIYPNWSRTRDGKNWYAFRSSKIDGPVEPRRFAAFISWFWSRFFPNDES